MRSERLNRLGEPTVTRQGVRNLNDLGPRSRPRAERNCLPGEHHWEYARADGSGLTEVHVYKCVNCPELDARPAYSDRDC